MIWSNYWSGFSWRHRVYNWNSSWYRFRHFLYRRFNWGNIRWLYICFTLPHVFKLLKIWHFLFRCNYYIIFKRVNNYYKCRIFLSTYVKLKYILSMTLNWFSYHKSSYYITKTKQFKTSQWVPDSDPYPYNLLSI